MTKKNSQANSPLGSIVTIVIIVVGAIIYAVSGVDFLGISGGTPSAPNTVATTAPTNLPTSLPASGNVQTIATGIGFGYRSSFWQVYFTAPQNVSSRDRSLWVNGIDVHVVSAIDSVQSTLDIAAFELNNEVITEAISRAHDRGVAIRIVTDNEHGIDDDDTTLVDLELLGIPIVDDGRSALMHNKFMIMDSIVVWTGSTNYTMNDVYRNNNNMIVLRSRRAVETYQAEFDEMFVRGQFGPRSDPSNTASYSQDGVPIEIYFASENEVVAEILQELNGAQNNIRFMAFSFTEDSLGDALLARGRAGIDIQGVFERTGSETEYSEMTRLFCAGQDVRQDGNPGILHHKVFIVDGQVVITGSFNFSGNATTSNDENVVIIRNRDIANLYLQEFARVQSLAARPSVACSN